MMTGTPTTKFCSHRTSYMEPSATSITVTGPVGKGLQAGTEDEPILDRPAPLRRLHDSGAGYKYPDLLTYLFTTGPVGCFFLYVTGRPWFVCLATTHPSRASVLACYCEYMCV